MSRNTNESSDEFWYCATCQSFTKCTGCAALYKQLMERSGKIKPEPKPTPPPRSKVKEKITGLD